MTGNNTLISTVFFVMLISGVVMRVISIYNFLSVRNVKISMTPTQVLSYISKDDKSIYRMSVEYSKRRTPFYAYSESLDAGSGVLTIKGEEDTSLYSACAVIQKYFTHKSATIKRAHYNFSKIMSFFIGLFSVLSVFIASFGYNFSDNTLMTSGMMIYIVTFLAGIVTSDFDIVSAVESMRFIEKNKGIFSVNHYYAKRIFMGYIFHKLSRAVGWMFFPVSLFVGMVM